jgi:hypothetical protein
LKVLLKDFGTGQNNPPPSKNKRPEADKKHLYQHHGMKSNAERGFRVIRTLTGLTTARLGNSGKRLTHGQKRNRKTEPVQFPFQRIFFQEHYFKMAV